MNIKKKLLMLLAAGMVLTSLTACTGEVIPEETSSSGTPETTENPYRTDREIRKDCLANLEKIALEQGALTAEDIEAMRAEIAAELEAAVVFGENSPEPDPDRIFEGLYA